MNPCTVAIVASFTLSSLSANAQERSPVLKAKPLAQWHGQWVQSEKINSALGFSDAKSREGGLLDAAPLSFQISLTEKIGDGIDSPFLQTYRDLVFKRMGHRIVATGKWDLTFKDNPGIKTTSCFVTEHEGASFLWVPADYVVVFGGKVSFLEGAHKGHDAIIIDFNMGTSYPAGVGRSLDTFAYQRKSK